MVRLVPPELQVWCEFAEPVEGPGADSVACCQAYARKWGMVVVCPILERDGAHNDTVWNTAVVIGHTGNVIGKHRKVRGACERGSV